MSGIVLSILFLLFLYFGYRDDYRRDKKKFIYTVLGVFGFIIFFLLRQYILE